MGSVPFCHTGIAGGPGVAGAWGITYSWTKLGRRQRDSLTFIPQHFLPPAAGTIILKSGALCQQMLVSGNRACQEKETE